MILCYSFDSRINLYDDPLWILKIYAASMKKAKSFGYRVKFYGDKFSIDNLKGYFDEFEDISEKKFILVDDLKLYIHEINNLECVTIDGDIILHDKIELPKGEFDVIFELAETRSNVMKLKHNPSHGYFSLVDIFDKYMDSTIPYWNSKLSLACNVGLVKFNNQKVKDLFLNQYKIFRDFFLSNIEPKENLIESEFVPSIIISQYNFGLLSEFYNLKVKFFKDYNSYTHFYGKIKFLPQVRKAVMGILNKKDLV